jgi:carbon storage regulator
MLVLTRKAGESFLIGEEVTVTVVRITGGGVRLGIEAPSDYLVVREELMDASKDSSAPSRPTGRHRDQPARES